MTSNGLLISSLIVLFLVLPKGHQCDSFAFSFPINNNNKDWHSRLRSLSSCRSNHGRHRHRHRHRLLSSSHDDDDKDKSIPTVITNTNTTANGAGQLEQLKAEEAKLSSLLASVRSQKLAVLRSRPLNIGIVGFGRFGLFIARSFIKYGNVIGTSRSDYSDVATEMGARFMKLDELERFVVEEDLDVIVLAVSIVSFESTVKDLIPHLRKRIQLKGPNSLPLIVDVASVKEHPRNILLEHLPVECDILATHPMFGPDSARNGWQGQAFVYEKTRINKKLFKKEVGADGADGDGDGEGGSSSFFDDKDICEANVEGMDRMERFLSIWEEEGCNMIPLSCEEHDAYSADSQFITHLVGRILGAQGLRPTPIDTKGFQSVLKLIENTNADSFDLFFGLYKYNRNSGYTIGRLRVALEGVVGELLQRDGVMGVFGDGNRDGGGGERRRDGG